MRKTKYPDTRQYMFLKKMRNHPHGLPLEDWPKPATLRRWMRRDGFRAALDSLRETFRMQADLMLAGASARAATVAQLILSGEDGAGRTLEEVAAWQQTLLAMTRLMRIDHMRQKDGKVRRDDVDTKKGLLQWWNPDECQREIPSVPKEFIDPVTGAADHEAWMRQSGFTSADVTPQEG